MREDATAMELPAWWARRRFGLLVHAGTASVPAWAPIGQHADRYRSHRSGDPDTPSGDRQPLVETIAHHRDRWAHVVDDDGFLPLLEFGEFDADAWASLARDTGTGYLVMTARGDDGLCWWDAPGPARTTITAGPRRNVLAEMSAACERADLVLGAWCSTQPGVDGDGSAERHASDIVERYGVLFLCSDGRGPIAAELSAAPADLVLDVGWGGDVEVHEDRIPEVPPDRPWEFRRGLGSGFGFNRAEQPDHLLSAAAIVATLTEVVAKGGHLLLAVGADAQGRIPEPHAERCRAAGGWIRRHRDLIDRAEPWTVWGDAECRYLVVDGALHAVDVSGQGRFAGLGTVGVERVETLDGVPVDFDHDRRTGVSLRRPPRRSQRLPQVYRIVVRPEAEPAAQLFSDPPPLPIRLHELVVGAHHGSIVQLGEGAHAGPVDVPDGVVVRGLGPDRTVVELAAGGSVRLGVAGRLEHCTVRAADPSDDDAVLVRFDGAGAAMLGCRVDGVVDVAAVDARIVSCHLFGVVASSTDDRRVDHLTVTRSVFDPTRRNWSVEIDGGSGHLVESCDFIGSTGAVLLRNTVGTVVRGNRSRSRWWGVRLVDTQGTTVVGNAFEGMTRAVDVTAGTGVEVSGNVASGGDSGCVVRDGAADVVVAGNRWERTRIGLLTWGASEVRHHGNTCIELGDPDGAHVDGP